MVGRICAVQSIDKPIEWFDPSSSNLVKSVSCQAETTYNPVGDVHIAAIDCGLKYNQIRCFCDRGAKVTVLPWNSSIKDRTGEFDALFISNGPGDPVNCPHISDQIQLWMSCNKPMFGICLGHQLIARALNLRTYKMKYGNRGHNQPCIHPDTGRCFITSQNHGYAVSVDDLPEGWYELFRNANDGSNEGLIHNMKPWMSVQFHPEHMAGPRDLEFLFDVFLDHVRSPGANSLFVRLKNAITYIKQPFEETLMVQQERIKKVLLLGSGGLSIGQAGEFDYSGSQALKALREEGIQALLINPNVATVQTTAGMADKVYLLPVTPEHVSRIIAAERPDGILIGFGGQTGLTCGLSLENFMVSQADCILDNSATVNGDTDRLPILEAYDCRILGTTVKTIQITEDRQMFANMIHSIGEQVAPAAAAITPNEAVEIGNRIGYPVLVRAAFALGGMGSGFADNREQLEQLATRALSHTTQVFIDKSLKGWKEVEYEVLRDAYNNCITVCNMENIDPVGIHTGESIVVAPSQTLSNVEYNMLRSAAIKVACHLRIVGECNIQFALDPHSLTYYIIEVNARLSRSSALASKATGYPLAYIATKLSLGYSLPSLSNVVTGGLTTACFEPSLDYCVVKVPRWDLTKFSRVCRTISSSMKSVGEVMAISRCFEEALQKALRMTDQNTLGFDGSRVEFDEHVLSEPTDQRVYVVSEALHRGWTVEKLAKTTEIDPWFLHRMAGIEECKRRMCALSDSTLTSLVDALSESNSHNPFPAHLLPALYVIASAKRLGFSDIQVAQALRSSPLLVTRLRERLNLMPLVRLVDTVAGEWPATTNYLYVSYADIPLSNLQRLMSAETETMVTNSCLLGDQGKHDVEFQPQSQILVLGSGVYRIGSSVEFDWCTVGCVRELRRHEWSTVMLNCNPETVSTDFDMCDRLYFDELSLERVMDIYRLESPVGVIVSMGGQTPNNIVMPMHHAGAVILGTRAESIDSAENRFKFSRLLDNLRILQPRWKELTDFESAKSFCAEVGYPCLVRPSYVLSGAAMNVAYDYDDLVTYLSAAKSISPEYPVVISQFILDAKEIDVDAVAQSGRLVAMAVSEHVENAGVHSGDATLVTPPQDLNKETLTLIKALVVVLADELQVSGPFNLQLIAKDNRLQIIEVNLRVSRSFPFVSKTLKYDFVGAATRCILGSTRESIYPPHRQPVGSSCSLSQDFVEPAVEVFGGIPHQVGVKVPVFSFSRLFGADVLLGVEMVSTGEVACFGHDRYEAFLLAQEASLVNTNGRLPRPGESVFLSIGSFRHKLEMLPSIRQLHQLGYKLFGSSGTADYYQTQEIPFTSVIWPYEENDLSKSVMSGSAVASCEGSSRERNIHECLAEKQFSLIVSLTMRKTGYRRQSVFATRGHMTRRLAVDSNVPLITDVKVIKLLAEALYRHYNGGLNSKASAVSARSPCCLGPMRCITSNQIILLPGLVDVHVHTRDPGQEYKEDWDSVTQAALAGGIVAIFAMPNTRPPVVDQTSLEFASQRAASQARCDYALFAGATVDNAGAVDRLSRSVIGLKMYLNETFTTLSLVGRMDVWRKHFQGETTAAVILLSKLTSRPVHICHVARRCEIELIRDAKALGLNVTCEVAPHHLFLSTEDEFATSAGFREVRPRLGTKDDVASLWANLNFIDCFATDHAPHLASEKACGEKAPPGFPGLESMLPLLLTAMSEGRLTLVDLVEKLSTNPRRIFGLPPVSRWDACGDMTAKGCGDTWVEVDMSAEWRLPGAVDEHNNRMPNDGVLRTRAGWSPFAGRPVRGRVRRVMLRGTLAFVDDRVLVKPGFGMDLVSCRTSVVPLEISPVQEGVDRTVYHRSTSPMPRVHLDSYTEYPESVVAQPEDMLTIVNGLTGEPQRPVPVPIPLVATTASVLQSLWTDGLSGHHVLSSTSFTKAHLHRIFNVAHGFKLELLKQKQLDHICRGKVMASVFFEPSTRTCNSFAVAMQRLGGTVVHFAEQMSSLNKGETVADTLRILASYTDCLVIRHPGRGAVQEAALSITNKPIINAGDGVGEHPTQALLDVFTIREEIGTVNGLTITMVGDLANGRTVHSLARLLCLYNVRLRYVTHCESLRMPNEVKAYVADRGIPQEEMNSLAEALPDTDVLYMTRVQAERLPPHLKSSWKADQFVITPELMMLAKPTGMIVMHPLPRLSEISPNFDSDPRAAYFRQAEHGVYIRMALLALVMAKPK